MIKVNELHCSKTEDYNQADAELLYVTRTFGYMVVPIFQCFQHTVFILYFPLTLTVCGIKEISPWTVCRTVVDAAFRKQSEDIQ